MKRILLVMVLTGVGTALFAQNLPEYRFASGRWVLSGDWLYQNDANARLAKVNARVPQNGTMLYEFDARYESGAEDGHGGFGFHIFEDAPYHAASWGAGKSYLLWLNYDEKPINKNISRGLSAQIYRSVNNVTMELVQSFDLNGYADLLTAENLSYPVHFKILANGDTGEITVSDPVDGEEYYVSLGSKDLPLRGNWLSLRTNGIRMSFTY